MQKRYDIDLNQLDELDPDDMTNGELLDHMLAMESLRVRLDVASRRLLAVRNARRMGQATARRRQPPAA